MLRLACDAADNPALAVTAAVKDDPAELDAALAMTSRAVEANDPLIEPGTENALRELVEIMVPIMRRAG